MLIGAKDNGTHEEPARGRTRNRLNSILPANPIHSSQERLQDSMCSALSHMRCSRHMNMATDIRLKCLHSIAKDMHRSVM